MATFAEGIESIRLACSLVLLIPALGIVLLGRRRLVLVATWVATATVVSWLRFVGWWGLESSGIWHALAGVGLVALVAAAWKLDRLETDVAVTAGAATIATWTWVPCVGRQLGDILNAARAEPWQQFGPTTLFTIGLFLPLVLVAAAGVALPDVAARTARPAVRNAGLGIIVLVGALVAVTLFDDLAGELARRSSF